MEITGYIAALFIGASLGLIGGGGSIITVPVLVYLMHFSPVTATAYSLFIVGGSSLVGAMDYARKGLLNWRVALVFALPSLLSVYLTRRYLVPAFPETLFSLAGYPISREAGIMILFAFIMLAAGWSMVSSKNSRELSPNKFSAKNLALITLEGIVVGVLTGIVGAGGGFLIIPALVILAGLPMRVAVGTSLLIISVKSFIGFVGDVQAGLQIDWRFLLLFITFSAVGIFLGSALSRALPEKRIQRIFGWFVLVMSVYILTKEILIN